MGKLYSFAIAVLCLVLTFFLSEPVFSQVDSTKQKSKPSVSELLEKKKQEPTIDSCSITKKSPRTMVDSLHSEPHYYIKEPIVHPLVKKSRTKHTKSISKNVEKRQATKQPNHRCK